MADDASSLSESLNLQSLIAGLMGDLKALRDGKISIQDAKARAELARQILRGVHYVVQAQKYLSSQALPAPEQGGG